MSKQDWEHGRQAVPAKALLQLYGSGQKAGSAMITAAQLQTAEHLSEESGMILSEPPGVPASQIKHGVL